MRSTQPSLHTFVQKTSRGGSFGNNSPLSNTQYNSSGNNSSTASARDSRGQTGCGEGNVIKPFQTKQKQIACVAPLRYVHGLTYVYYSNGILSR